METSSTPPQEISSQPRRAVFGAFSQLTMVIGVAFMLATLFTAWTPSVTGPGNTNENLIINPVVQPTPLSPDAPTPTARARPLIGVVVGHWGDNNDPGAVCPDNSLTELEVNQNIAAQVKVNLESGGLDVVLLKEFDPRLEGFQASALVSIHADSCTYVNDQATGFKVAAALANPYPERGARLTSCLRSRYARATGLPLHSTSITDDMTSYHAFSEIHPNTTAAIIETGFLNLDRELLTQHPEIPAQGISDGIFCFINNEDVSAPPPQTTP